MSTTPSTSEIRYTVVGEAGGVDQRSRIGLSAVLLNRGDRPIRAELIAPFAESGVDELVVVLGPQPNYEVEQLASRIPRARFLLLSKPVTLGEQLNLGIREARSPYVLTIWSDMYAPTVSPRLVEKIREIDAVCAVPVLRTERNETIPSIIAPAFYRSLFRTVPVAPGSEGSPSLYVYGDTGVFLKDRFELLGGYDTAITNPYWQRLDFGMRAYLWGDSIRLMPSLRIQTSKPLPPDDTTPDASYARFHLKNLAIRFVRDQGRLPVRQLLPFVLRSGLGASEAVRQFRNARSWVRRNCYRFTQDARRVTELWEVDE
ncbi:MAG: hypothetical protein ACOC2Y_03465 [Spirochaetota bacterium]